MDLVNIYKGQNMKSKNPIIEIPEHLDGEGKYVYNNKVWEMSTLRDAVKELEVYDLQLAAIDLSVMPWRPTNMMNYLYHHVRINKADLKYPVILDPTGFIIDGWHRVSKALLRGDSTIKAVRLKVMPEEDEIRKVE